MDAEAPSVYTVSAPTARRHHRCCECGGYIESREAYQLIKGCWDGRWYTFKTCVDCESIRSEVDAGVDYYEERPPLGCLSEHILDAREMQDLAIRYLAIRRKRQAPESPGGWVERLELELIENNS